MKLSKKLLAAAFTLAFAAGTLSSAHALSRKPEDNLIYATSTEPIGLDPALVEDSDSGHINANIYESLLRFKDGSTDVEPCLAESWTISEDGLVYTFKLRQSVKFHDGTPFNAAAVKYNIDRQVPENQSPKMAYAQLVYGDVAKVEVLDEYTIAITLKKRSTPFLRNMAMSFASPIASPKALSEHDNLMENPCGTGPYKLVAWDKGQQLILTANEDYWGPQPPVQNVVYRIIKETSARVVALNNGEVDIINSVDSSIVEEIESAGNKVIQIPSNNVNYMMYNCREGYVTADREVRLAIAQAINIPELVQTLYHGYAQPAHSFLSELMMGYDKDVKYSDYDPEAARKTFAAKGITSLKMLTYTNPRSTNPVGGQVLAEAVQAYLDKVGVKAEVIAYDWGTFKSRLLTEDWDVSFIGWICINGDPDNFISPLAAKDPVSNKGMWINEEFIKLIQQGTMTPDGPERDAIYRKAENILAKDVGVLPLSHADSLMGHRPNISGQFVHPVGLTFFNKISKQAE